MQKSSKVAPAAFRRDGRGEAAPKTESRESDRRLEEIVERHRETIERLAKD